MNTILNPKDLVAFLALFLSTFIVTILQRRSGKVNRSTLATAPPSNAIPKSGTESDANKDRRPGGE